MESLGRSILVKNLEQLKASRVDPTRLARKLKEAGVITDADVERASNKKVSESERWDNLVLTATKSSTEGTFQKFIDVLLTEEKLRKLGSRMKDTYTESGRVWMKGAHPTTEPPKEAPRSESSTICDENVIVTAPHETSSDSTTFWQTVFLKRLGIQSKEATKYVGCEVYPHLVVFARTPEDKKVLRKLLKMESEETTFWKQRGCQRQNLIMRLKETDKMLKKLSKFHGNGKSRYDKDVDQAEKGICEYLQVPPDFWPFKIANLKIIIEQLKAFQKQISTDVKAEELNDDASVVCEASEGYALQGILLTRNIHDQLQRRQKLLKPPQKTCLMPPLHPQHVITKQFESRHQEKVFTDTVSALGYSAARFPIVDFVGSPFEAPSGLSHLMEEGHVHQEEAYCSIVQYFIMPLASCLFDDDQLQLSNDAIKDLKAIEGFIDSLYDAKDDEVFQRYEELHAKCKRFFQRFGSHASKGPFHFGGTYKWTFCSSGFQLSDTKTVQQLQRENIVSYVGFPVFQSPTDVPYSVKHDSESSGTLMKHSFCVVSTLGGPQGVIGLPGWKNGLIANITSWSLIDRGTTLVPVWDIITKSHSDDLKKPHTLATLMNQVWNLMNQQYSEKCRQDPVGDVAKLTNTIKSWNSSPDMQQGMEHLHHLERIKQNVSKVTMRPQVWPTVYLSQPDIQTFLKTIVDHSMKQSTAGGRLPEGIKVAIKKVVEPLDLDAVKDFSSRKHISRWVYSTESFPIPMDCENMLSLHKYFQYALGHICNGSEKGGGSLSIRPGMSPSVTIALEKVIHSFTNHLRMNEQRYEETFVLTMLLPFKYDADQHLFLTSLSFCDLKYLCNKYDHHCRRFSEVMKERNVVKSQKYLFLLAIEMYNELNTPHSQMKSYLQCIEQRIGIEMLPLVENTLHSSHADLKKLQSKLESLHTSGDSERNLSSRRQQCEEFFSVLGLIDFFPRRLTLRHALEIREDTLENVQHLQKSEGNVRKRVQGPTVPGLYPFLMLQKIMAFDYTSRTKLILSSKSLSASIKILSSNQKVGKDLTVHPMDGLLALLHCADNFLRQDLMSRLATCQLAVPLLLPDPFEPHKLTLPLWAMRSIVREWQIGNGTSKEGPLIGYPSPVVSFLRIGKLKVSKSQTINSIISDSKLDIFFHYHCSGGTSKHFLVHGLVEVCWYLPSKRDMIFPDLVTFANLHGDARKCPKQVKFLSEVSFMNFVFINKDEDTLNGDTMKVLKDLARAPGGLTLLQVEEDSDDDGNGDRWYKWLQPIKHLVQIVNLNDKNDAEIREEIREEINCDLNEKWNDGKSKLSLEQHAGVARLCNIFVDEDDGHCMKGKVCANAFERIIHEFTKSQKVETLKGLLPLQGPSLWRKWALTNKEYFRKTQRDQYEPAIYEQKKGKEMETIRNLQLQHTKYFHPLMESFLASFLAHTGKTRHYFLQWIRLFLDNLTREHLPELHTGYKQKVLQLQRIQRAKNEQEEKVCKSEIQTLNKRIIDASFGFEHLLREVSQMYEAVTAQERISSQQKDILCLPEVAAELMADGYPIELMDGDAAHVPIHWVSAVLSKVQEFLHNPKLLVLSVLGVQSSGKSTLMNTVFGVRFSTSAGRCTRGAFMQLLPIHRSLRQECKCDYFLIIDTEGLRAPELDALETHKHDNELATFVIGLANLTITNLYGETMGDMDDILQTAVHAFLRMKEVSLTPSCHFVHQNVTAVAAGEKLKAGQVNFTAKLDMITQTAAKEEGKEDDYKFFTDVIDFDSEKHVFHFQNLWKGDPPMAPVNPGYSTNAQFLKLCLINYAKQPRSIDCKAFQKHLKDLWNAILHENFVFSFRNTLEVIAYNTLEGTYGDCSWKFKQEMMVWEQEAHNRIASCEMPLLSKVYEECCQELSTRVPDICQRQKKKMEDFFENSSQKEIIIKWKNETMSRMEILMRELQTQATDHIKYLKTSREAFGKVDSMKETHRQLILDHVKQLASQLETETLNDHQLEERFNVQWNVWIEEIKAQPVQVEQVNVKRDVQKCLTDFETLKPASSLVFEKLRTNPLGQRVHSLRLEFVEKHVKAKRKYVVFTSEAPIKDGQDITNKLLEHQHMYMQEIMQKHYNPNLATDILRKLFDDISHHSRDIAFTDMYRVDMAVTVCQYAVIKFQEMVDAERKRNDPVEYLERSMRGTLFQIFKDVYNQIAREVTAASAVCDLLRQSVKKAVVSSMSGNIADGMKGVYGFLQSKQALQAKILLDIGEKLDKCGEEHFTDCLDYLKNVQKSLRFWLEKYIHQYCCGGKFAEIAREQIKNRMIVIRGTVSKVSAEFSQTVDEFKITDWLTNFHRGIQHTGKLQLDLSELRQLGGVYNLTDVDLFRKEVMKGLEVLESTLKKEFENNMSVTELSRWGKEPHDLLFESLAGCTEQCPFCKEQCDLTIPNHSTKHSVTMHRPQCLGRYRNSRTGEMVLNVCTADVANEKKTFKNCDTKWESHHYNKYTRVYPNWSITGDRSREASLYWKWLVAHYDTRIAKEFCMKTTTIPSDWNMDWSKAKKKLEEDYNV